MARHKGPRRRFMAFPALLGTFAMIIATLVGFTSSAAATGDTTDNKDCPDGYVYIAKAEWTGGGYVFEGDANGVTITGDVNGGTFTSSVPVAAVVVVGAGDQEVYYYDPPVTSGSFTNENVGSQNPQGEWQDISHVTFCGQEQPPGDTVTVPTQETVDPCNPEGVTNNVAWKAPLPTDTDKVDWSESNNGATRTATLKDSDDKWSDGTTAPKVFNLPADSGVKCVTPPPPPPPPTDVCPQMPGTQPPGSVCVTPPPADACPDMPGIQSPGTDCNPPTSEPKVKKPKAKIRTYCVTENFGEGVAKLNNRKSTKRVTFRIVLPGRDKIVKVRAGKVKRINLTGLRVGSVVKVRSGGKLLDKARVPRGCGKTPPPDTGARTAANAP